MYYLNEKNNRWYKKKITIDNYTETTDTVFQEGKVYYTRSGNEGSYVYTKADVNIGDSTGVTSYFYVQDLSGSENTITANSGTFVTSTDGINWSGTLGDGTTGTIPANGKLYIKNTSETPESLQGESLSSNYTPVFEFTSHVSLGGDFRYIMCNDISNVTNESGTSYSNFFIGNGNIISAKNLIIPIVTGYECYFDMFNRCTSLTEAPYLPATTLSDRCYSDMFNGCTSLTKAPNLPATTLVDRCYSNMFIGCEKLNSITASFTIIDDTVEDYIVDWLTDVSSTGTFNASSEATWYGTGAATTTQPVVVSSDGIVTTGSGSTVPVG